MTTGDDEAIETTAVQMYSDLLFEAAQRIDASAAFLLGIQNPPDWPLVRAAASELRGVLEMLVYGGLLTHKDLLDQTADRLAGLDRKAARRIVKKANDQWWPRPVEHLDGSPRRIEFLTEGDWLLEEDWDGAHSRTSNLLHVRNPLAKNERSLTSSVEALLKLHDQLVALLTSHVVMYEDGRTLLGQISPPDHDPRVMVNEFGPVELGPHRS